MFDTLPCPTDLLVTGSARLNAYRRGSDSLVGCHDHFRLHPSSMRELVTDEAAPPEDVEAALIGGGPP